MTESAWDRAMAGRISVGDDVALAAVYDRYGALVHGLARRIVGDDRAKDITQDVFLYLWREPHRYDPERGSLRGWLALIARRRAIDAVRSTARRDARERRAATAAPSAAAEVEDAALATVAAEHVRAAIDRLPADQKQAIELAYLGGLTFRDVAVAMGTAEGTAKSRLRLGLDRLAHELAGQVTTGGSTWN